MIKTKLALAILALGLLCFISTASAIPYHDGHSHPGTVSWWQPVTHHWYSPSYYYNFFDPWWNANFYGPMRTTYYWYRWGW